jgi:putative iron-dependent peroxidase
VTSEGVTSEGVTSEGARFPHVVVSNTPWVERHVSDSGPEPQAVLSGLTASAVFLVVTVNDRPGAAARVRDAAAAVNDLVRAVGFRQSAAALSCVVGFGDRFWDLMRPTGSPRPSGLHPFAAITGAVHDAPATPGDVLFHIRAERADLTFELSRQIMAVIGPWVQVQDHVTGFRYFDARDLLGFVDGTENPTGRGAAAAALIGPDDPEFAGGSYVMVQKYLHDLTAWQALSTEHQERIVGRSKIDDIELADDVMPDNSHVSLNSVVDENGDEQDILRDNMVFGDAGSVEYGTYYIAYAANPAVPEEMLRNMFVGKPAGNYDHILDVSTAITGTQFFVPSLDLLESLGDDGVAAPTGDGSLRIGSLKGEPQ